MIRRRWPDTVLAAAAGLGLLAWSASLIRASLFWGAGAFFFGLALLGLAVMGPADTPCPLCGRTLHGLFALSAGKLERCPHCLGYFQRADQREVPADHVAAFPSFSIPIDQGANLPRLCCVCAAPAERIEEVVHRGEGRLSNASPLVMRAELRIAVPYCGAHDGGVQLVNEDLAASVPLLGGPGKSDRRWVLRVRSYGFYRAALAR